MEASITFRDWIMVINRSLRSYCHDTYRLYLLSLLQPIKTKFRFIYWTLALCLLAETSYARETLHIGTIDSRPYSYESASGELQGFFIDLTGAIAGNAGFSVSHHLDVSYLRLIRELEKGYSHCSPLMVRPLRDQTLVRVALLPWVIEVIAMVRQELTLNSPEQLYPIRVAFRRGLVVDGALEGDFDSAKLLQPYYTTNHMQSTRMFKRGRVDAVLGTAPILESLFTEEGVPPGYTRLLIQQHPLALYCSHKLQPQWIERLAASTKQLTESGQLQAMVEDF